MKNINLRPILPATLIAFVFFAISCSQRIVRRGSGTPPVTFSSIAAAADSTVVPDSLVRRGLDGFTFYLSAAWVPRDNQVLGFWDSSEAQQLVACDSASLYNMAKTQSRRLGGNAFLVTGSAAGPVDSAVVSQSGAPCYAISGKMLRTGVAPAVALSPQSGVPAPVRPGRRVRTDKWTIGGDVGWGWRMAPISSDLTGDAKALARRMSSGIGWSLEANWYFHAFSNGNWGVGVVSHNFQTGRKSGMFPVNGVIAPVQASDHIYFFGPQFAGRLFTNNGRWSFLYSIGVGYIGYTSKVYPDGLEANKIRKRGETVGFTYSLGGDVRLAEHIALDLKLAASTGTLNETTTTFPDNSEGLGNVSVGLGLKFLF